MSERLILHHTYDRGIAFDVSEHGNHGELLGGVAPPAAFAGSLQFGTEDSYVRVPPSKTFDDLRSVRVRVRFMWVPDGDSMHIHNLVEGDESFSLEVTPLGMLVGRVVDRAGAWVDVRAPIGTVQPNEWVEAELHHDGISRVRLSLDDTVVAERFDLPGPVRTVGSYGVGIGQHPHPWFASSFEGYIDDVRIWAYDPEPDVRDLLDECCVDRASIDGMLDEARASGWNGERAGDLVREVLDLATEMAIATRAADPARTVVLDGLSRDFAFSIATKDSNTLVNTFEQTYTLMLGSLTETQIVDYGNRAMDQLRRSPFAGLIDGATPALDSARKVAALLCLDGLLPPDARDDHEPERPRRPDGDPDVDRPDGKRPADWDTGVNPAPPDEPGQPMPEGHSDEDGGR